MEICVSLSAWLCDQPPNGSEELTPTAYPQRRRVAHILGDNHQAVRLIPSRQWTGSEEHKAIDAYRGCSRRRTGRAAAAAQGHCSQERIRCGSDFGSFYSRMGERLPKSRYCSILTERLKFSPYLRRVFFSVLTRLVGGGGGALWQPVPGD